MVALLSTGNPLQRLVYFLCCYSLAQRPQNDDWFTSITEIHDEKCSPLKGFTCQYFTEKRVSSGCCGYCDCASNCRRHGSCCPNQYDSSEMGVSAVANTR